MPFLTLNGLFSASSVRSDMMAYRVSARRDDAYKKGKVKYMPVDVMGRVIYCVDRFGKYDLEYVEDMIQGECHIGSYFLCVSRTCCLDGFNDCVPRLFASSASLGNYMWKYFYIAGMSFGDLVL